MTEGKLHGFQLWVNMPAKLKMNKPEYIYIDADKMSIHKDDYIGGFPSHPHRGIETVTYMLSGEFEHEDSTGAKGRMTSGDVQWMKTGNGIIHSEMPAMREGKLHGFQLWVNMPAKLKMNKPEYIYIDADKMSTHKAVSYTHLTLPTKRIV